MSATAVHSLGLTPSENCRVEVAWIWTALYTAGSGASTVSPEGASQRSRR